MVEVATEMHFWQNKLFLKHREVSWKPSQGVCLVKCSLSPPERGFAADVGGRRAAQVPGSA